MPVDPKVSVAPMLDWTDRHCRYFLRQISRHAVLYTEMVTTGAIIHGKGDFLGYNQQEHPVVLQLGGSDPQAMAECAKRAEDAGYDEVNINVGCPSDRVQNGRFGACLMADPDLVGECVSQMKDKVNIPVTVKSRIGIDEQDSYEFLQTFITKVRDAGCQDFIIHARKAWLSGLSPKQNREIPPLDYPRVYQIKKEFPELNISINGGIQTLEQVQEHLKFVDGVMIGREFYTNPYLLSEVDSLIYNDQHDIPTRFEIVEAMFPYIEQHIANGGRLWHVARHMLGLFQGQPRARSWRRYISENANKPGAGIEILQQAMMQMQPVEAA